jgi:hypothetical protein
MAPTTPDERAAQQAETHDAASRLVGRTRRCNRETQLLLWDMPCPFAERVLRPAQFQSLIPAEFLADFALDTHGIVPSQSGTTVPAYILDSWTTRQEAERFPRTPATNPRGATYLTFYLTFPCQRIPVRNHRVPLHRSPAQIGRLVPLSELASTICSM